MSSENQMKFIGKPNFKTKRSYHIALSLLWVILLSLFIVLYGCHYLWNSPLYVKIILWAIVGLLTAGGGGVFFTSYEKYKEEFEDPGDEKN